MTSTLVDNSLGRLLLERRGCLETVLEQRWSADELRNAEGDTVGEFCRYLVRPTGASDETLAARPLRSIRVLDPACGSGHFLIYAFELLWRAYREEEPDVAAEEHAAAILEHNLYGIDIDLRACELAALGLYLKAREYAPSMRPRALNVVCADSRLLNGARAREFLARLEDDQELKRVAQQLLGDLRSTAEIGSLLRVRGPFLRLLDRRIPLDPEKSAQMVLGQRDRTLAEVVEELHEFENSAVERQDMGGRLFAADAERSVGMVACLAREYDVVLMNPPYNKFQELPEVTRSYLEKGFPLTKHNIFAAFVEQAIDLIRAGGYVAMLTPLSYMYLYKLAKLRQQVIGQSAPPELVLEFGWDILDPAQIQTAGSVLRRSSSTDPHRGRAFVDLTSPAGSAAKEDRFIRVAQLLRTGSTDEGLHTVSPAELGKLPGSPFAYWASDRLRLAFDRYPPLDRDAAKQPDELKIADAKQGLATADDTRFLRRWWEVPPSSLGRGRRWVPFVKGEQYARWYHDPSLVVLWANDGREIKDYICARYPYLDGKWEWVAKNPSFYFREGLTWQLVSASRKVRMRHLPPGCIFGHKGPSAFPSDPGATFQLLGFLNSSLANVMMLALTTERGWEVGQLSLLPIAPDALSSHHLGDVARELHDLHLARDTGRQTSSRFAAPLILQVARGEAAPITGHPLAAGFAWPSTSTWHEISAIRGSIASTLAELVEMVGQRWRLLDACIAELEREVDAEVFRCYGLEAEASEIVATLQQRLGAASDEEAAEADEESDEGGDTVSGEGEIEALVAYYAQSAVVASADGVVSFDEREPDNAVELVRRGMRADWGDQRAQRLEEELEQALGRHLRSWLLHEWFPQHVATHRSRPICWLLWSGARGRGRRAAEPAFACVLDYHRLTADTLRFVQGRHVRPALDRLRGELDRLQRESTEAAVTRSREAARARRAAEDARERESELREFDAALTRLIEGPERPATLPADASWAKRKVAEVRDRGYRPVIDFGVLVNFSPLVEAGVVHLAADRIRVR